MQSSRFLVVATVAFCSVAAFAAEGQARHSAGRQIRAHDCEGRRFLTYTRRRPLP